MSKISRRELGRAGLVAAAATTAVVATSSSAIAQQESTWDAIGKRGSLRLGGVNAPPWFIHDAASGAWSGLGTTVATELAKVLGVKLEIVEVQWGTSIAALQANKIDLMPILDPTPERAKAVDFPPGIAIVDIALGVLVADNLKADNWADFNNEATTISVTQGTSQEQFVTRHLTKATILRLPSNDEVVAAFQSGRANVASAFIPPLVMLQQRLGRGRVVIPKPVHASSSSVAVRLEADKRFRDWLGNSIFFWYNTAQIAQWYDETVAQLGVDPSKVPGVLRTLWTSS
jgi:polar amino acid transport system substrate-binding protein